MADNDLFAVQNPVTGEMGYCCIMGQLGELFALAVYLGAEGLGSYENLARAKTKSASAEAGYNQICLMASFLDRESLYKKDLDVIKALGLKFRGRNAWPVFRSHLPGYYPWHLTAGEAEFLTLCLRQTVEVGARVKENPGLLLSKGRTHMLARIPEKAADSWRWTDKWFTPMLPSSRPVATLTPDEATTKRLRASIPQRDMTWEVDVYYAPFPVKDDKDDRPLYPLVLLCVDRDSGFIFGMHLMSTAEKPKVALKFLEFIVKAGVMPSELAIAREDLLDLLEPAASAVGIQVRGEKRLKQLQRARRSLESSLARGPF